MKESSKIKRGDFIMILVAAFVAIPLFAWRIFNNQAKPVDERVALVNRNGKEVTRIDLNQVKKYEQVVLEDGGIPVIIEVEPGRIRFQASECPDQICVKTGWISNQGQSAACLPAKTIITI